VKYPLRFTYVTTTLKIHGNDERLHNNNPREVCWGGGTIDDQNFTVQVLVPYQDPIGGYSASSYVVGLSVVRPSTTLRHCVVGNQGPLAQPLIVHHVVVVVRPSSSVRVTNQEISAKFCQSVRVTLKAVSFFIFEFYIGHFGG
jgi:hypothetical protein